MAALRIWIVLALLAAGCGGGPPKATPTPTPATVQVTSARAVERTVTSTVQLSATAASARTVNLSAPVAGPVIEVGAELGEPVTRGQRLLTIGPPPDLETDVEVARQRLNEALTKIGRSGQDHRNPGELPSVRKARAQLENAQNSFQEYIRLREEELVSDQNVADKQASYLMARAEYEEALQLVEENAATVLTARAQLAQAQKRAAPHYVMAPFDGYVQEMGVTLGTYLQAGTASNVIIVSRSPIYLLIDVPQEQSEHVAPGRLVWFESDVAPGRRCQARVTNLAPTITPATRAQRVKAEVTAPPAWLRPGIGGTIKLQTAAPQREVLVPAEAVLHGKVFVLVGGRVQGRAVKTLTTRGGWTAVTGVRPGEEVAASNLAALQDGGEVHVTGPAQGSPP